MMDLSKSFKNGQLKSAAAFFSAFALFFALIPLVSLARGEKTPYLPGGQEISSSYSRQTEPAESSEDGFRVLQDGETRFFTEDEYVFGVLAAEISPESPVEALKAQAVASYTFAVRRRAAKNTGDEYDITGNPSYDQGFTEREKAVKNWGSKAEEYSRVFDEAIQSVKGVTVTYGSEIANTVYHSVSPGKTLSAKEVWGEYVPYLVPVESVGDILCGEYLSEKTFSPDELSAVAESCGAQKLETSSDYIGGSEYGESGSVISCVLGGKSFSGTELRKMFSLASSAFELKYNETSGLFVFTVRGHGHGVGMSQNGACVMAGQGAKYDEILKWYYTGCEINVP